LTFKIFFKVKIHSKQASFLFKKLLYHRKEHTKYFDANTGDELTENEADQRSQAANAFKAATDIYNAEVMNETPSQVHERITEAAKEYARAAALDPKNAEYTEMVQVSNAKVAGFGHIIEGDKLKAQSKHNEAAVQYQKAVKFLENQDKLKSDAKMAQKRLDDTQKVIKQQQTEENEKKAKKSFEKGLKCYENAWKLEEDGEVDEAESEFANALRYLKESTKLNPDNVSYQKQVNECQLKIDGNTAFNDGNRLRNEANELKNQKKFDESIEKLELAKTKYMLAWKLKKDERFSECIDIVVQEIKTISAEMANPSVGNRVINAKCKRMSESASNVEAKRQEIDDTVTLEDCSSF
jgi:hypothetical protein